MIDQTSNKPRTSTLIILTILFSLFVLLNNFLFQPTVVSANSNNVIIQTTGTSQDVIGYNSSIGVRVAQSFTLPVNAYLTQAQVVLQKSGTPTDEVRIRIYDEVSGSPSSNLIATSSLFPATEIYTSPTVITLFFDGHVELTASQNYWLVLERTGSNNTSNYYQAVGGSGSYSGCKKVFTSSWQSCSQDLRLVLSYDQIVESSTGGSGGESFLDEATFWTILNDQYRMQVLFASLFVMLVVFIFFYKKHND